MLASIIRCHFLAFAFALDISRIKTEARTSILRCTHNVGGIFKQSTEWVSTSMMMSNWRVFLLLLSISTSSKITPSVLLCVCFIWSIEFFHQLNRFIPFEMSGRRSRKKRCVLVCLSTWERTWANRQQQKRELRFNFYWISVCRNGNKFIHFYRIFLFAVRFCPRRFSVAICSSICFAVRRHQKFNRTATSNKKKRMNKIEQRNEMITKQSLPLLFAFPVLNVYALHRFYSVCLVEKVYSSLGKMTWKHQMEKFSHAKLRKPKGNAFKMNFPCLFLTIFMFSSHRFWCSYCFVSDVTLFQTIFSFRTFFAYILNLSKRKYVAMEVYISLRVFVVVFFSSNFMQNYRKLLKLCEWKVFHLLFVHPNRRKCTSKWKRCDVKLCIFHESW